MPRSKRHLISQEFGSYHIISHITDETPLFSEEEKQYLFDLMEKLAEGFFIHIHAYCIMGNHFHVLATIMELDAEKASKEELLKRYRKIYGEDADPPGGSFCCNGEVIPDGDGGIKRLRKRLGSISRFVQEFKQDFSRWYNKKHKRKGHLWRERFKGVLIDHGVAELVSSCYIDLNPVRAGITMFPEKYKWSSIGLRENKPAQAQKVLYPITPVYAFKQPNQGDELCFIRVIEGINSLEWYRAFVYSCGGKEIEGKANIPKEIVESVLSCCQYLNVAGALQRKIANFSKGIALGFSLSIMKLQQSENRKRICPHYFIDSCWAATTRVKRE